MLFRRTYELILGEPDSSKGLRLIGDEQKNQGLQISFRIKKNIDNKENSNTCIIDIYNLSEDSIKYIQRDNMAVVFKVGYEGDNKVLFTGMINEIRTDDYTGRTDRKTTLKCVPAETLVYQPTLSKTFPAETTPRQIINYLVGQSTALTRASFNSDNIDDPFPFGYPVQGTIKTILNELARDFNFVYRIDGKRLYINDPNKYQSKNSVEKAFVISPTTGLIGVPTYSSGDSKKLKSDVQKKNGVKFTTLMNPLIIPGSAISIKNTQINGVFRVDSCEYSGDWRGNKWEVECLCSKINTE